MGTTANLISEKETIVFGNDNIVIRDCFETIRGGRTLDVSGYLADVIYGGHPIILDETTGDTKPFPVTATGEYGTLPAGHRIIGILRATITKEKPFAAIMVRGSMNPAASVIDMSSIITDVENALHLITFNVD